jgi:hypothetical protein
MITSDVWMAGKIGAMVTVTVVFGVDHSLINITKQERSTARITDARKNQGDHSYDECKYNGEGFTTPPPRFCFSTIILIT